jgi:hypothetical protein
LKLAGLRKRQKQTTGVMNSVPIRKCSQSIKDAIPKFNNRQSSCKEISVVLSRQAEIPTHSTLYPYIVSNTALHRKLFHASSKSVSPEFLADGGWQVWRYLGVPNGNITGNFCSQTLLGAK